MGVTRHRWYLVPSARPTVYQISEPPADGTPVAVIDPEDSVAVRKLLAQYHLGPVLPAQVDKMKNALRALTGPPATRLTRPVPHEVTVDVDHAAQTGLDRDQFTAVCVCGWVGTTWTTADAIRPWDKASLEGQTHVNDDALDRHGLWEQVDVVTCPRCDTDWRYPPIDDRCDCGYEFIPQEGAA